MIKDLNKFKRLFVFGCSYTHYKWPTWAHVLASEIDNVEFYNFGRTGSGNLFISLRIAEANKKFNFNEHDLVAVMWTSFTREDRWLEGGWTGQGSIYNQNLYPESWVKEFADPNFYLIRDFALIELTSTYLKSLPCTSLIMSGWPIDLVEHNKFVSSFNEDILRTCNGIYKDTIQNIPLDLRSFEELYYNLNKDNPDFTACGHTYKVADGQMFADGHPNPGVYRDYLNHIGVALTDKSKIYADKMTYVLKNCATDKDIGIAFKDVQKFTPDLF